jgi:hypothetical protein
MSVDLNKFAEELKNVKLPFVYTGERLAEERCQKALKKIGVDTGALAVIVSSGLMGLECLAVLENGIKFSLPSCGMLGSMPKPKGTFLFDEFVISSVSVKKPALPKLDAEMIVWDLKKEKSYSFKFNVMPEDDVTLDKEMADGLAGILKTLTSKTGTEYDDDETADGQKKEINPNDFDFVWGSTHTTITLQDDSIVIRKAKIDEKTKIQTLKKGPVTISRSAIGSVKMKRRFSPVPLLTGIGLGAAFGFLIIGGLIAVLLGAIIGLIFSFPKTMVIYRKDGTKYRTVISGDPLNKSAYERFMNVIFK